VATHKGSVDQSKREPSQLLWLCHLVGQSSLAAVKRR